MRKLFLVVSWLAVAGCMNGGGGVGGAGSTGSLVTHGANGATSGTGSGMLGPTASVRVVNLIPGTSFDAWGANTSLAPVKLLAGLQFGTVSEYFDVPVEMLSNAATFVILPSGEMPATSPNWEELASTGSDRARFQQVGLTAGQHATLIVDNTGFGPSVEELAESKLPANDPAQATLHIAARIDKIGGGVVRAFGVVGQPCLATDSVATPDSWHVAPGAFDFGVYDLQMVDTCTTLLGSTHLDVAAGADELVVVYLDNGQLKFLNAPIAQP